MNELSQASTPLEILGANPALIELHAPPRKTRTAPVAFQPEASSPLILVREVLRGNQWEDVVCCVLAICAIVSLALSIWLCIRGQTNEHVSIEQSCIVPSML